MTKGASSFGERWNETHTCAAAVALRPTTFGSPPVANAAPLPRERESAAGVLQLKDETAPGPVEWGT